MPPASRSTRPRPFGCSHPGCSAHFEKPVHLRRHQISHRDEALLECSLCQATFGRIDSFQRHVKRKHPDDTATAEALPMVVVGGGGPQKSSPSSHASSPPLQRQPSISALTSNPAPASSSYVAPPIDLGFGRLSDVGSLSFDALVDQVFADYLLGFDVGEAPKTLHPPADPRPLSPPPPDSHSMAPAQIEMQTRDLVVRGVACPPMPGGFQAVQLASLAIKRMGDVLPIVPPCWLARVGELSTQRPLVFVALVTLATLWTHSPEFKAYGRLLWNQLLFRAVWSSSVFLLEQPQRLKEILLTMTMGNCFAFMAQDRQAYSYAVQAAHTGASMTSDFGQHAKAMAGGRSSLDVAMEAVGVVGERDLRDGLRGPVVAPQLWTAWLEAEQFHRALTLGCLHHVHMETYIEEESRPRLAGTILDCPLPQPALLWDAENAGEWAQRLSQRLSADPGWPSSARLSLREASQRFFDADPDGRARRHLFSFFEPGDSFALLVLMEAIGAWAWQSADVDSASVTGWQDWESATLRLGGPSPRHIGAALDRFADCFNPPHRGVEPHSPASFHLKSGSLHIRWHALQLSLLMDLTHCRLGLLSFAQDRRPGDSTSSSHRGGFRWPHNRPCRIPTGLCPFEDQSRQRRAAYHAGAIIALFLDLPRSQTITFALACAVCHAFSTLTLLTLLWSTPSAPSLTTMELCESRPMCSDRALPVLLQAWLDRSSPGMPSLCGQPVNLWAGALLELHQKLGDVEQGWIEAPGVMARCKRMLEQA